MNLTEAAQKFSISIETIKKFITDFHLNIDECLTSDLHLKPEFEKFLKENMQFLKQYEDDLNKEKSLEVIAAKINQPKEKIAEILGRRENIFDNGFYKTSVSSFQIDQQLGADYQFIYKYFDQSSKLQRRDFIGYRDLFFYVSDALESFINKSEAENWGIQKPAGIILYGPPGSGKIFWGNKISEITKYNFKEVKQHYLGSTFVNGNRKSFNDFLINSMKEENMILFLDNFETIAKSSDSNDDKDVKNEETKEIILHYISKFEKEGVLMIGSANFLADIDPEIFAPGRFDILIPVFPPNVDERAELLLFHMTKDLKADSLLLDILKTSKADIVPFWKTVAGQMKVYSNTMLIDFTQSLKKKLRKQFNRNKIDKTISEKIIKSALHEASAKLTSDYLNLVDQFLIDVRRNNADDFPQRISDLSKELEFYKIVPEDSQRIGFHLNELEK